MPRSSSRSPARIPSLVALLLASGAVPACGWLGPSRDASVSGPAKVQPQAFREGQDAASPAEAARELESPATPAQLLAAVERLNQSPRSAPPVSGFDPTDRPPATGPLSANTPALSTDEPLPPPSQLKRAGASSSESAPDRTLVASTTALPAIKPIEPSIERSEAATAAPVEPPELIEKPTGKPVLATDLARASTQSDASLPVPAEVPTALDVPTIALCQRVDGFGRYTPLPSTTFFAGKPALFILYTEVDRFAQTPEEDAAGRSQFVTALAQRVEVFLESDGSRQFAIPEQSIRERSRSRRRDFFLVQRVELPRTLSVGKYNLKIRVTDQETGAQVERIVPIQVIADPSGRPS